MPILNPSHTPLLIIAWRRPHTLRQVINAIRPVAPKYLFVACDGPSPERSGEVDKVNATRAVIEHEIDWPCTIQRLYSDVNQGCAIGPIRAISWFFRHVEAGIIIEDDCVPNPDFFPYCTTLLQRFQHDTRVWSITGNNYQNGQWRGDGSYFFSRIPLCWGWATWRRCWLNYDSELSHWPALRDSGMMESIFDDPVEATYWYDIWQKTYAKSVPITWWDYQWVFLCASNGGLTVAPNLNLVSNIGFGEDATHSQVVPIPTLADQGLGELLHPLFILPDIEADRYTFDYHFGGAFIRHRRKLLPRLKNHLRSLSKHFQI